MGSVEDGRVDLYTQRFWSLETECSSQSPVGEQLACTAWRATAEKRNGLGRLFSWLQQKHHGQLNWTIVLGGRCAHELLKSSGIHGRSDWSVNGALISDCVVFPTNCLVELPFWYSWLVFLPKEQHICVDAEAELAACCCIDWGQMNAMKVWSKQWLPELQLCEQKTCLACALLGGDRELKSARQFCPECESCWACFFVFGVVVRAVVFRE